MNPAGLIAVLEKLVEQYARLLRLSELQHDLVRHERTDELLALLDDRAGTVAMVTGIEAKLRPVRQNWAAVSASFPEAERERAGALFARTRELLGQVMSADQDDAIVLQQRKLNVGRQLHQTHQVRRTNNGYAAATAYAGQSARVDVAR